MVEHTSVNVLSLILLETTQISHISAKTDHNAEFKNIT